MNSDTGYLTPNAPPINDVYNYAQNKQISAFERPLVSIISLNYQTPRMPGDSVGMKALSWVTRDWTVGAILRYQSGQLLHGREIQQQLPLPDGPGRVRMRRGFQQPSRLGRRVDLPEPGSRPAAVFAGDPNCRCFDPTKHLVLNPQAWTDVGPGQFGNAPAYQEGYRWQRQPEESMSFGRIFPLGQENRVTLQVRSEFQNIFNRTFYGSPSAAFGFFLSGTNPTAPVQRFNTFANGQPGALSGGYGFVNTLNGAGAQPRSGQIVARITF